MQPVEGDTYWVDGVNGSPAGTGDEGDPVDTISRELDSAPGVEDVVLVAFDPTMPQILDDALARG